MTTDEAGKVIVARIIINSYILEANRERVKNHEQVVPFILGYIRYNTISYSRCQALTKKKKAKLFPGASSRSLNMHLVRDLHIFLGVEIDKTSI